MPLATLVRVGPDEHQVRRFASRTRWVTLAMLAHAYLAVVRADEHARHPAPDGLIPFTCNEIQRLFTALIVRPLHDAAHRLVWSLWASPPGPSPDQPSPLASRTSDMKITTYGRSATWRPACGSGGSTSAREWVRDSHPYRLHASE